MHIAGRTAIVTGGASGLGLATAELLVSLGASVVIVDLPGSAGDELADRLGPAVRFSVGDITSETDVKAAIAVAVADFGELNILVNCAGVAMPRRILGRQGLLPLEEFRRIVEVNLVGTFNTIRLAAARMAEAQPVGEERGVIINTASVAAFDGQIGQASYAASKAGIVGLTLVVARELASRLIRCVTIAPGIMDTPLLGKLSADSRASLAFQVPHPSRLGRPSEYALLAAHIIENPLLNGETVRLDGALRMGPR